MVQVIVDTYQGRYRGGVDDDEESDMEEPEPAYFNAPGAEGEIHPQGEPAGQQGPEPKAGTGAWYHYHRTKSIVAGHAVTVLEACFWLATLKHDHKVTDVVINMVCGMVHRLLLAPGNLFPPSYHIVKKVLGVDKFQARRSHICEVCWTIFPDLDPALFAAHAQDQCACGGPRFLVSPTGVVTPQRSIFRFDVRQSVIDLIQPTIQQFNEYKAAVAEQCNDPTSFWGSPAGRMLDARINHRVSNSQDPDEIVISVSVGVLSRPRPGRLDPV